MVKRDDMQIEMAFPHVALNHLNAPLWGHLKDSRSPEFTDVT